MNKDFYPFPLYIKHLPILIMSALSLALNIFSWGWIFWHLRFETGSVFLHYNILFGIDFIGEASQIYYIPTIGLTLFIVNFLLGWFFYRKSELASYLLLSVLLLCEIFLAAASSLLVSINI